MAWLSCALLLLGLAATTFAGPVDPNYGANTICASFCPENTKFGFESGKTYEYDYESIVKTHIPVTSGDHSALRMRAIAKLEVISQCEMALVLDGVTLEDQAPNSNRHGAVSRSREFAAALTRRELRFAFVSGKVESLCPNPEEETWVLNIKRGIISNFQNTMNDFHTDFRSNEVDVTGDCPISYTTEGAGWSGVYSIRKSKDLTACKKHMSADTIFQGTAYQTPSKMQSLPVLKGSHECTQKISSQGILTESICQESHIFRPFSKGNSGATTDVITKLTFKRQVDSIEASPVCFSPKSLVFDHVKPQEELTSSRGAAEAVLREMCSQTTPAVSARAPSLFGKLVRELKKLDANTLEALHRDLHTQAFCKSASKFLHDAIPVIGNAASARLIRNLIRSSEATAADRFLWLNSLAFVQEPTTTMLAELTPLITDEPVNRQAVLSISSLVNNYCRKNTNCGDVAEVRTIINAFERNLAGGCNLASRQHDLVMMSLKAIGNTGHAQTAAASLNACMRNPSLDIEIRVAAINAFRRMACDSDTSELMTIFENTQLDSELRINAYISLVACPRRDLFTRVANMLANEEVNQVGSFVWTHLTNLMETSSPLRQEVRQIVEQESLRRQFNIDKRKFSRNIEKSFFSDLLNSGASVESNIIWSQASFVPRSASLNLTANLFGHSVNLVEVGGRVEGMDAILDKFFDKNRPADANRNSVNDINDLDRNVNMPAESELKGSSYIRVFGNEIAYADFHDLDAATVRDKFNYLNWLIELAKEHSIDYSKSFQYLDTTVSVATMAGFPLRLHVEGNGVTDIKLSGKMDLRNVALAPRNMAIVGSIAPSAAIEVTAEMGIDAFAAETGIRTVDTLHTNTIADGRIELREGKIFNMDINMPRDQMEIFSAKHDLYVVYRNQAREMTTTGSRVEHSECLGGRFTHATGLELCTQVSVPETLSIPDGPYVPLTSPGIVSLVLHKRDTFTGYHFEARALSQRIEHESHRDLVDSLHVSFNTPGSRVNRELTMDFSVNYSERQTQFTLVTPWMPRAHFEGQLTKEPDALRATALASYGSTRYEALAEIVTVTNKYNTQYKPKFELKLPNRENPTIYGTLLYRQDRKMDVNMHADNIFSENVNVEGSITGTKASNKIRYDVKLKIKSPLLTGAVTGYADRSRSDGNVRSSRLEIEYKVPQGPENRITLSGKLRDNSNSEKTHLSGTFAFTSLLWIRFNTDTTFTILREGNMLRTSLEGSLAGSEEKTFQITQEGLLSIGTYNKKGKLAVDVKVPYMSIDHKVDLTLSQKKGELKAGAEYLKAGRRSCLVDFELKKESVTPLKANGIIRVIYPGRQMSYRQTIEEVGTKHYRNNIDLQLQENEVVRIRADYKMLPRHELEAQLTSPFNSPITFTGVLNPVLQNFEASASLEHKGRQFAVETTLDLKSTESRASIKLIHPRRTITSDGMLKKVGKTVSGEYDLKWDAARDVNKKFNIKTDITLTKMRPKLIIDIHLHPNRFMKLITGGEFLHRNDIYNYQGNLRFQSSFENFEEITSSFRYKKSLSQLITSGLISWAPQRQIEGKITINARNGLASLDANAELKTPFVAMRRLTYELDYVQEGSTFSANTKGVFNRHNIGIALSGHATRTGNTLPNIDGSITMTSSIPYLRKIELKGSHTDTGRKCHSDVEVTWAEGKKVKVDYNMEHARSGYHLINNGDLVVTTPFTGYRTNKITWRHNNDDNSITHSTEVQIAKQISRFTFGGTLSRSGNTQSLEVDTALIAPGVDSKFTLNHLNSIRGPTKIETTSMIQWATGRQIQITNDYTSDVGSMKEAFKFVSPFEGYETITLDLDNKAETYTFTGKNEMKWPGNTVALNARLAVRHYEVDGNIELITPVLPTQKLTFSSRLEDEVFLTSHRYEYKPEQAIEMGTRTGLGNTKSFTWELTSPFEEMKRVEVHFEYTGHYRDFQSKAEFSHNLLADKIELNTRIDSSDLRDLKANIELKTPWETLRFLGIKYSHRLNGNTFRNTGSFMIPSYKATFMNEMTLNSLRQFNTKTNIMYRRGQKIELMTNFDYQDSINGEITFTSPFEKFEDVAFTYSRTGPLTNVKSTAELKLDKTRKISANFEFQLGESIRTFGTIDTPFIGYKSLGFTFNMGGEPLNWKMDWSFNRENERLAGQESFSFANGRLNIRSTLETPYTDYERFTFTFEHAGSLNQFNNEGLFEGPMGRYTSKSSFRLSDSAMNARAEIRTPISAMQAFIVEAKHEGDLSGFTNDIIIQRNEDRYEAASTFSYEPDNIQAVISVKTPTMYSISFTHRGPYDDFNNNLIIQLNENRYEATSSFSFKSDEIQAVASVKTPTLYSISFTHRGPYDDFNNNLIIQLNENRYEATSTFSFKANEIQAVASVKTPTLYSISFTHRGPYDDFNNNLIIQLNENRYEATSTFSFKPDEIQAAASVKTPTEYGISFTLRGQYNDFSNNLRIQFDEQEITSRTSFKMLDDKINGLFEVLTPFEGYNKFAFIGNHEGPLRNFKCDYSFEFAGQRITVTDEFHLTESNSLLAKLHVITPFETLNNLQIELNHEGTITNFANNGFILINSDRYTARSEFSKGTNTIRGSAAVNIPAEYSISFMHNAEGRNFNNEFTIKADSIDISGNSRFTFSERNVKFTASLNTPFRQVGNINYIYKFAGEPRNFKDEATLTYGTSEYSVKRSFEMPEDYNIKYYYELRTPHEALRLFSVKAENVARSYKNFRNNIDIVHNEVKRSFSSDFKWFSNVFKLKIAANLPESYSLLLKNKGDITKFTTDLKITYPDSSIDGSCYFEIKEDDITGTFTLSTPFTKLESQSISFEHKRLESGFNSKLNILTSVESFRKFETIINHEGTLSHFTTDVKIVADAHTMDFRIQHRGQFTDFSSSSSITLNGETMTATVGFDKDENKIVSSGSLATPFEGYRRFAYTFNHDGPMNDFHTNGNIETPFRNIDFSYNHKGNINDFECVATLQLGDERYAGNLMFKAAATSVELVSGLETPSATYKDFGLHLNYQRLSNGIRTSINVETPFEGYRVMGAEVTHEGDHREFQTTGTITGPERPITFALSHECGPTRFHLNGEVEYDGNKYTASKVYSRIGANIDTAASLVLPIGRYAYSFKNTVTDAQITTEGSLETPHEGYRRATFDFTHQGDLNNFATSAKINPFSGEGSLVLNHHGDMSAFNSNGVAEWNEDRISGTAEFKNEDGQIEAQASVTTSAPGYERFQAEFAHSDNGRKLKTEARLQTPFSSINDPSFVMEHRGDRRNFRTTARLVPAHKTMKPISFTLDHNGHQVDFTTTGSVEYGRDKVNVNARFQKSDNGLIAKADVTTPFRQAKKFGFDIDHSYIGNTLRTKGSVETPFKQYKLFAVELNHDSTSQGCETTGIITSPFSEPIHFELKHEGLPSDFKTTGKVETDGDLLSGEVIYKRSSNFIKVTGSLGSSTDRLAHLEVTHMGILTNFKTDGSFEGMGRRMAIEAGYKKTSGFIRANHDASLKIQTPFTELTDAEITLRQGYNDDVWSGQLKGFINDHRFDTDYRFEGKQRKSMTLTMRQPRPMAYSASYDPTTSTADASFNWDKRFANKHLRLSANLVDNSNAYKVDHRLTLSMTCPHRTRTLVHNQEITANEFVTSTEYRWDAGDENRIRHELELAVSQRGREHIHDGRYKIASPIVNFEINGNHKLNPGRRHVTQINIITTETLRILSDIKTPGGLKDFSSSLVITHPRIRDVKVDVKGKIDNENILYDGTIDIQYAEEKISFAGKIADMSNRYRTRYEVEARLKHPQNNLDASFESSLLANRKTFKVDGKFDYLMSRDMRTRTLTGEIEFDKVTEEMKVKVRTPVKRVNLVGRRTINEASRQHYSMSATVDGRSMSSEVDIDSTIPGITAAVEYAPESTLHLIAKYKTPDHFVTDIYHQVAGRKIPDASFEAEIVGSRLFKVHLFERPTMISDFAELFHVDSGLGRLYRQVTDAIVEDLRLKLPGLRRAAEPIIVTMETVSLEVAAVAVRLEATFNDWYDRNEFYTRDIVDAITTFYSDIRSSLDEVMQLVNAAIGKMQSLYQTTAVAYEQWRLAAVAKYYEFDAWLFTKINEFRTAINNKLAEYAGSLQGSLLDLANYIRNHPGVQRVLNHLQAKAERILERITSLADQLYQAVDDLLSHPRLSFLRTYISRANEKMGWIYDYINLEERARTWLHQMKETGLGPLRTKLWQLTRDVLHLDDTKITTWAPERGEFAFQVYLPLTMNDLHSIHRPDIVRYIEEVKSMIPDTDWMLWDTLYAFKPSSDIRDWVPPFKAHATIAGTQHYMTFDKKFFEFAGECSYLLARDFIDGSFSVIVNYQMREGESTKKSITVVHGTDQVEILPEFRIEVNDRRSELPIIGEHTAIYRVGNTLRIDNDHGVKITCDLIHDHCTVSVTGWYFGKTAGLLGTYDYEPSTDNRKPNGDRATSPEELASSWTVGRHCRVNNHARMEDVSPVHPRYEECATIFSSETSPFRPCFKQIEPSHFMKMCINGDACNVASFYVKECQNLEVPIRMPRQCVTCEMPDGRRLSEGQEETIRDRQVPRMADVIFVVSHGECNSEAAPKLRMIATQIINNMKDAGVRNVMFGLVGFGGTGLEAEPHSHTMDGQLINTKTTFARTLADFRISNREWAEDAFAAIKFASRYPFRAGASKSIVLLPCSRCGSKDVSYSQIQEALSEHDIRFHMLIHEDFKLSARSKTPKTSFMYGIDRNAVFTNKDARESEIRGDRDLRRHTVVPKDLCVALAHETDGTVFNVLKLTQTTSYNQKSFATVFSRVLSQKGRPSKCQRCECRSDETGVGITHCNSCEPTARYIYDWTLDQLPEPDIPIKTRKSKQA